MKVSLLVLISIVFVLTVVITLIQIRPLKQCAVIKHTSGKEIRWISVGPIRPFGVGFKFHDKFSDSDVIVSGDVEFVKSP